MRRSKEQSTAPWHPAILVAALLALACTPAARAVEKPLSSEIEAGLLGTGAEQAAKTQTSSAFDTTGEGFDAVVMNLIKELTNFNRDDGRDKRISIRKEDEERDKVSARERYNIAAQDAARKLVHDPR